MVPSWLEKIALTDVWETDRREQEATGNQQTPNTRSFLQVEGQDRGRPLQNRAPLPCGCLFQLVLNSRVSVREELCRP